MMGEIHFLDFFSDSAVGVDDFDARDNGREDGELVLDLTDPSDPCEPDLWVTGEPFLDFFPDK